MVFSASMVKALEAGKPASDFFTDQLLFVIVGSVVAAVLWRVNYRTWVGPALWVIWAVAVVLILATAVMGTDNYGAKRWLYIGSVGVQPSEFCKIAFLLVAVRLLLDYRSGMVEFRASMVRALIFLIVPIAIMYRTQSDLGTTVICAVGIIAVMWMGGVPRKVIAAVLAVCVVGGLIAIFGTGYRAGRLVFLDPWNDGKGGYGTGYNIIRSYYALSEGGLFGVGLFASESDFIFAVIGEELGLVGAMAVVLLFFGVLFAGLSIAERSDDEIGTMVAGGCTVMLVFQAFLNIACVIGVFPTTGKPLPFISAGGSSMLASFILLGLILSVSRPERGPSVSEQRRADLRLVRQERPEEGRPRPSRGAGRPDRPGRTGRPDHPSGSRSSDRSRRPAQSGTAPSPRSRSSRR